MKNNLLYLLIVFLLIASSCEKESFLSQEGDPVFVASIPFTKKDSIGFNAGDDLYYMFASHTIAEEEKIYSGLFGKQDICTDNCAENFSIKFHQKLDQESKLTKGNYQYYSFPRDGYKHNYTLISDDEDSVDNASWRVGDETLTGDSISIDAENDTEPGDGIRLLYSIPNAFTLQFERSILPMTVDCNITLEISNTAQGIQLEVVTDSPFTQVSWSTGVIGNKIVASEDLSIYTARVFAGSGCSTDITIHMANFNLTQDYAIGFNQNSFGFSSPDNPNNAITISYTDENNVFYTSSTVGQILPFRFEVLEISDYELNELGDPTWMIKARFDCILFGENGTSRRIQNGNALFAVSY